MLGVVFLLGERAHLRFVLGAQLLLGGLAVLQVLLGHGLLQNIQAGQLEQRRGFRHLVDAVLHGLLAHDLRRGSGCRAPGCAAPRSARSLLCAGDGLDVLIEEVLRDLVPFTVATDGELSAGVAQVGAAAAAIGWQDARPSRPASRRIPNNSCLFLSKLETVVKLIRQESGPRCSTRVSPCPIERCDGCIDQPVAFELRKPSESVSDDDDAKVAALARAGVAGVLGAVVDDFERHRCQFALQRRAQLLDFGWFPYVRTGVMARRYRRAAAHEPGDLRSDKHEIDDRQTDDFERYPDVLAEVERNEQIQRAQERVEKHPQNIQPFPRRFGHP